MTKKAKGGRPKREGVVTYTRLTQEDRKSLEKIAFKEHRVLSDQIAHALSEWLEYLHEMGDLRMTTSQREKD